MAYAEESKKDVTYLSQRGLAKLLGASVTTVQRYRDECLDFPRKRAFSPRSKGWIKGESIEWVEARPAA